MKTHMIKPILKHVQQAQAQYDNGEVLDTPFFKNGRSYVNVIKRDEIIKDLKALGADAETLSFIDDMIDYQLEYAKDKREFMKEWKLRIKHNNYCNKVVM